MSLRIVCFAIYMWHNSVISERYKFIRFILISRSFLSHLTVTPKTVPKSLNPFWIPLSRYVCSRPSNYRVTLCLRNLVVTVHKLPQTHWQLNVIICLLQRVNRLNWKLLFKYVFGVLRFCEKCEVTSVHLFAWQYLSPFEPSKRI